MRSKKHFVLSVFGIVIGIAAFVFFLGLSFGARNVLNEIFPVNEIEVVAPRATVEFFEKKLTDETVAKIQKHPRVVEAVPRMILGFSAFALGHMDGTELRLDLNGTLDGVDPSLIEDERIREYFKDWENEPGEQKACLPNLRCADHDRYYCNRSDRMCYHRVPAILSPAMLELYNKQFARSYGMPVIPRDFVKFIEQRGGLAKMRFLVRLGRVGLIGSSVKLQSPPMDVEGMVVGIDKNGMSLGATIPLPYVKRWREQFLGDEAAGQYSSIVVRLRDSEDVAPFVGWLEKEMDLRTEDDTAQTLSTVLNIVTLLFLFISLIIVFISAINIAHNFFMQVSERQKEIGVMRAVGATRRDVMKLLLGESALIGLAGGVLGILVGVGGAMCVNWLASLAPDFPFKPDSFFLFPWWVFGAAVLFSVVFSVAGGYLPARKAAKLEPAIALTK